MLRIKIFGAGSIGNHFAHASRVMGWQVTVCDTDPAALERMKKEIYPGRYGAWDSTIETFTNDSAPKVAYDLVLIGTPPESHLPLAFEALKEKPQGIILEKPVCGPALEGLDEFFRLARTSKTRVYVGYTHAVAQSMEAFEKLCLSGEIGEIVTFDVEFREHWGGIFKAHPWLNGPADSYLGFWQSGGGASGEHSHAMNLWQHLSHSFGFGRVSEVSAMLSYKTEGRATYDDLCFLNLKTDQGKLGRVIQDVVTTPSRKVAIVQGTKATAKWCANYDAVGDAIVVARPGQADEIIAFPKKRPDDFIQELKHLAADLRGDLKASPLSFERGFDTMLVIAASHESHRLGKRVRIDYSQGYRQAALCS